MQAHKSTLLGKALLAIALVGLGWQALVLVSERIYVAEVISCEIKADTFGIFPNGAEKINIMRCKLTYKLGNEVKVVLAQTQISLQQDLRKELAGKKASIRVSQFRPDKAEFLDSPRETWGSIFFFVLTGLVAWLCLNQIRIR